MSLIDADEVLKIVEPYGTTHGTSLGRHSGVADAIYYEIAKLPTIEAEPVRHGEWITSEMTIDSGCTSCSCCNSEYYIGDLQALEGDNDFVMYCPNCGAKMDGGIPDETVHDKK